MDYVLGNVFRDRPVKVKEVLDKRGGRSSVKNGRERDIVFRDRPVKVKEVLDKRSGRS